MFMLALVTKKRVRIPLAVNPRFPQPCSSAEGEPDPKARPTGVADGHPVNIPDLPCVRYHDGVTQKDRQAVLWL